MSYFDNAITDVPPVITHRTPTGGPTALAVSLIGRKTAVRTNAEHRLLHPRLRRPVRRAASAVASPGRDFVRVEAVSPWPTAGLVGTVRCRGAARRGRIARRPR